MNSIMVWLIINHGVDAFMHSIILRKALGLVFSSLIFIGFLFTGNKAMQLIKEQDIGWSKPVETVEAE